MTKECIHCGKELLLSHAVMYEIDMKAPNGVGHSFHWCQGCYESMWDNFINWSNDE